MKTQKMNMTFALQSFLGACMLFVAQAGETLVKGVYTGWAPLPEIKGEGKPAKKSDWYRLHHLAIKGKSVELTGVPISIQGNEMLYSASEGGFITYKGQIYEKDGKLRVKLQFVETEEDYLIAPKGGWPDKDLPIVIVDQVRFTLEGITYTLQDRVPEKAQSEKEQK